VRGILLTQTIWGGGRGEAPLPFVLTKSTPVPSVSVFCISARVGKSSRTEYQSLCSSNRFGIHRLHEIKGKGLQQKENKRKVRLKRKRKISSPNYNIQRDVSLCQDVIVLLRSSGTCLNWEVQVQSFLFCSSPHREVTYRILSTEMRCKKNGKIKK
jgi:hypothetical protein